MKKQKKAWVSNRRQWGHPLGQGVTPSLGSGLAFQQNGLNDVPFFAFRWAMPRALRYQYTGAVCHLMAHGDGGKAVFETDEDRKGFLFRLGKICESHGWRMHAWVLMSNHFHLMVETPEANLVTGMKLLLGTFSQGLNRRRSRPTTSRTVSMISRNYNPSPVIDARPLIGVRAL